MGTTSSVKTRETAAAGLVMIPGPAALIVGEDPLRRERNNELVAYLQGAIARRQAR